MPVAEAKLCLSKRSGVSKMQQQQVNPELTYSTPIRAAAWADIFYATTFTTRGYAASIGRDPDELIAESKARGHELVGSIYTGAALYGDKGTAERVNAEARAKVAKAISMVCCIR
jgi:hypothetical protein